MDRQLHEFQASEIIHAFDKSWHDVREGELYVENGKLKRRGYQLDEEELTTLIKSLVEQVLSMNRYVP